MRIPLKLRHHPPGFVVCVAALVLSCEPAAAGGQQMTGLENSPLTVVTAVEGGRAVLPCDVKATASGDPTIMVLYYQGAAGTPIYSVDGRSSSLHRADHWHDSTTLGSRAYFNLDTVSPGLVLEPVQVTDEAIYRCRVDFQGSRSRNIRIKLTIVVPPRSLTIVQGNGVAVKSALVGPYDEGAVVSLRCDVQGGNPSPAVNWWYKGVLIDSNVESRNGDVTTNTVTLPRLTRADLEAEVNCQASNTNSTPPLSSTVRIDMTLPPLDVRLEGLESPVSEAQPQTLVCDSSGSRPPAALSWWRDHAPLLPSLDDTVHITKQNFADGNVSRSTLLLLPRLSDEGVRISCRAENSRLPYAVLEDHGVITVHYIPRLQMEAGQKLDMNDIKEGADVYFECSIQSNPKTYKVEWLQNGEVLHHNLSAGVILSNQSLVLQKLHRESSGEYVCAATNAKGTGHSEPIHLNVKYAPVCHTGEPGVHGGGKHESLNVSCEVDAHPIPTHFRWAFNTSAEVVSIDPGRIEAVSVDLRNVVYTPRSQLDYGSLLCWASNSVGEQRVPCVFHIIHTAVPDPVQNCTVSDVKRSSASVRCQAGWDGGLPQTFTLSVSQGELATANYSNNTNKTSPRVLANTSSSPKAEFAVTGLEPGKEYFLTVAAVNSRGHSSPVSIAIETLQDNALKRTSPGMATQKSRVILGPVIAVLLAGVASLTLSCAVLALFLRIRRATPVKRDSAMAVDKADTQSGNNEMEHSVETYIDPEEQSPDIIPYRNAPVKHDISTGTFTLNQMPLMDIQHHERQYQQQQEHHQKQQQQHQLQQHRQQQQDDYIGHCSVALQRTGSLPRTGRGRNPPDRYSTLMEYDSSSHNPLSTLKLHSSLHSLHQLSDRRIPDNFTAPPKITKSIKYATANPPTSQYQFRADSSCYTHRSNVPLENSLEDARKPISSIKKTQYSQTLNRHPIQQHILPHSPSITPYQERSSPSLQTSFNVVPYSSSPISTAPMIISSIQPKDLPSPIPTIPTSIASSSFGVEVATASPADGLVDSSMPQNYLYSKPEMELEILNRLPPFDNVHSHNETLYKSSRPFCTPPPMFSNTPPPPGFSNSPPDQHMEQRIKYSASLQRNSRSKRIAPSNFYSAQKTHEILPGCSNIPNQNVKLKSTVSTIQVPHNGLKTSDKNKKESSV